MANTSVRLTFLYPHLYRSFRASEPLRQTAQRQCLRHRPPASQRASFATASTRHQRFVERHGKAVEPFLMPGEVKEDVKVFVPEATPAAPKDNVVGNQLKPGTEREIGDGKSKTTNLKEASSAASPSEQTQGPAYILGNMEDDGKEKVSVDQQSASQPDISSTTETGPPRDNPLEKVIKEDETPEDDLNLPHLHPPPYVHNFDSYTLVKEVEKGGFTPDQAITAMKAVRVLLANNLELAKQGLVSRSDVENQSYLFRAACSELRTEVQNNRKANDEKMRRERTLLQHEVDTLNQKLTQDLLTLKDELQGMFNDRKMAVRMEQREMDSGIQQLNYKITVALNSDSKSEVEGLRWVLTRRSVLAIVFMAAMVLSSLRYASYRAHENELEERRQQRLREADAAQRARHKEGEGMADSGTQTEQEGDETVGMRDLPAGTAAESLAAC